MANSFKIGHHDIGKGFPCFLIAEVGLAHDGSLGFAQSFVDALSKTGVNAVKFQTHIAEAESTARERFRVPVFPQDSSRYDYWKRTSFTRDQWIALSNYTTERGMIFLSSPFSHLAVEYLTDCHVPAWKIASGEVSNHPMLRRIAETKLPVLVSSGMSSLEELDEAVAILAAQQCPFGVFQCTTAYPCPPDTWGLNLIEELSTRYQCPVGLSDHSGGLAASLAAVTLGANMLEFHVTFHRGMFGPDVTSSLTIEQTTELVSSIRAIERAISNPVRKENWSSESTSNRTLFTKSVVAARDIPTG
ncbi:MAG: N-acetylneuraminate synthase, partial [Planctomycetes bacterium]|nr:N-acetylneuraminate synthase [Planctomycetota bacterium]